MGLRFFFSPLRAGEVPSTKCEAEGGVPWMKRSLGSSEGDEGVDGRDIRGSEAQHVADFPELDHAGAGCPPVLQRVPRGA